MRLSSVPRMISSAAIWCRIGETTYSFPEPSVNVKTLSLTLGEKEKTVTAGTEITVADMESFAKELLDSLYPALTTELSAQEITTLVADGTVSVNYVYGDQMGVVTFTFEGKDAEGNAIATTTSHTADVVGKDVETYTLTATYTPDTAEARALIVGSTLLTPAGATALAAQATGIYHIHTESIFSNVNKTASVVNEDSRLFALDLSFTADLTDEEITVVEGSNADVTLVLDTSGSMIYTDAAIISAQTSAEAYALAVNGALDTSKVYFTSSVSTYGEGITLSNGQSSYFGAGAVSSSKAYGVPTSGNYLFYSNGSWYMGTISSSSSYGGYGGYGPGSGGGPGQRPGGDSTTYSISLSTSSATKLTASNFPTTVYTNRSEVMIDAAQAFVNGLTEGSRVAIVTFGNSNASKTRCSLTKLDATGKATVLSTLENCYGVYSTATFPSGGLTKANTILTAAAAETGNKNIPYVVYFADGDVDDDDTDSTISAATTLKKNATVYAVAYGVNNTSMLEKIATDKDHVIQVGNVSGLGAAFTSISQTIVNSVSQKAIVTDVIDSRFVLTDANGTVLANGAVLDNGGVVHVENGTTWVTWEVTDKEMDANDTWTGRIYVKAKDTFLGGNKIQTNGDGSGVVVGTQSVSFPKPTVNVKLLPMALEDVDFTYFLGETFTPADELPALIGTLTCNADIALNDEEVASLLANGSYTKTYGFEGGQALGVLTYTLTADNLATHTLDVLGQKVETYRYSVSYEPYSVAKRTSQLGSSFADPIGTVVTNTVVNGNLTVSTVAGTLTITKKVTGKYDYDRNGDGFFTYKITNLDTGDVYYKTLRIDDGEETSTTLTNLPMGIYQVEELDTMAFVLAGIADNGSACAYNVQYDAEAKTGTCLVAIGYGTDNGIVIAPCVCGAGFSGRPLRADYVGARHGLARK